MNQRELRLMRDALRKYAHGLETPSSRQALQYYLSNFNTYYRGPCQRKVQRLEGRTDLWSELAFLSMYCKEHKAIPGSVSHNLLDTLYGAAEKKHTQLIHQKGDRATKKEYK